MIEKIGRRGQLQDELKKRKINYKTSEKKVLVAAGEFQDEWVIF
jgi:hypothetical protein